MKTLAIEREVENYIRKFCEPFLYEEGYSVLVPFHDLGLDSLDVVELIMNLEKEFGINIKDDLITPSMTPEDLIKIVILEKQFTPS